MSIELRVATVAEMHPVTLYQLLQLRTDVFVVEQQCPYPELDGRDLEPGSLMVWAETAAATKNENESKAAGEPQVIATLRILHDLTGDVTPERQAAKVLRIGRVTAHPAHRGSGLARQIFQFGLEQCDRVAPGLAIVLDAQEPLESWYGSFGFTRTGPTFVEDDIPHIPMRREAS